MKNITKVLPKTPENNVVVIQKNNKPYLCIALKALGGIDGGVKHILNNTSSSKGIEGEYAVYEFPTMERYVGFEMFWAQNVGEPITYLA